MDLAIFSDYFEKMGRVEGTAFLLLTAMDYDVDLEPIAFTAKEYMEPTGLVQEIIDTGKDIPITMDRVKGTITPPL